MTRLERIAELVGKKLTGKSCAGMKGVLEEGSEVLEERVQTPPNEKTQGEFDRLRLVDIGHLEFDHQARPTKCQWQKDARNHRGISVSEAPSALTL